MDRIPLLIGGAILWFLSVFEVIRGNSIEYAIFFATGSILWWWGLAMKSNV